MDATPTDGTAQAPRRRISAYEASTTEMSTDEHVQKEVSIGRRVALYRLKGDLGAGNFSQVKLAYHLLTRERVAIKMLDKLKLDSRTQKLLSREISIMENLNHPNIVRIYEVIETISKLHIVLEFCSAGDLYTKITNDGKLSEREARPLIAQIVSAFEYMHSNNIIHRDLKAENIYYSSPKTVKVGDFGFGTNASPQQTLSTFCGSPPYAAPELFKDESYYGIYVDIWALGILIYFVVTGLMPFRADTVSKLKQAILTGYYEMPDFLSRGCTALISSILKQIPTERVTMPQIRKSSWLDGEDFPRPFESSVNEKYEREVLHTMRHIGIADEVTRRYRGDLRNAVSGIYRILMHQVERFTRDDWAPPHKNEMDDGYWAVFPRDRLPGPQTPRSGLNGSTDSGFGSTTGSPSSTISAQVVNSRPVTVGEMDECSDCRPDDHYHRMRPPVSRLANALSRGGGSLERGAAKLEEKKSGVCVIL